MELFDFIKTLSETNGVSGLEAPVRELIVSEIRQYCDSVKIDKAGNIIAQKGSGEKKILVVCGMDEPGFIISGVKSGCGAFLSFEPVGRIEAASVISESVVVGENHIPGVISLKAVHLSKSEEREKPAGLSELYIDIGAGSEKEAEQAVMTGDYAAFKSRYRELGENAVCNKAIGLRACCGVLAELLKQEFGGVSLICAFTVQRQTGGRGARVDLEHEGLSAAVVLDTNHTQELGKGAVAPFMSGETAADRELVSRLLSFGARPSAQKKDESEISSISIKGGGVSAAELDIPVKNSGTASEIADKRDVRAAYEILFKFIKSAGEQAAAGGEK